jgi:hypothetical protein
MKHGGAYRINKRIKSSLPVFELSDGATMHFVVLETRKSFGKCLCKEPSVDFSDYLQLTFTQMHNVAAPHLSNFLRGCPIFITYEQGRSTKYTGLGQQRIPYRVYSTDWTIWSTNSLLF